MADSDDNGLSDAARLQQPIARLLRPLVRPFIRYGTTFPALCDLLRELYVNVAVHDFALPDKEQTDSRISLLTGIHRKEVRRLREAGAPVRTVPASVSRTSQIVALWLGDQQFADKGAPAPLRRGGDEGRGPTFESLVEEVTRTAPRAVLDEWLDRKIVSIDEDGRVALGEAAIAPNKGDERQLYYFGRNLHDHIAAAVVNIVSEPAPFMERAVHYEDFGRQRPAARDAVPRAGDGGADRRQSRGSDAPAKRRRRRLALDFGVYVYRVDEQPPQAAASGQKGVRA